MFNFFKRRDKNETKDSKGIMDKLHERQTVINKLDFNFEHLNKYLLKCIASYLSAIYKQNPSLCEKYVTADFYENLCHDIDKSKNIFKYSNDYVNIVKAELEDQKIESVNYISSITIKIEVTAVYHRQNLFTGTIKKIEEIYTESILFKFDDNGWKIFNILNQNFKLMNDDTIIRL
jgi:hypothetical protein